jgi:DNA primase
MARIKDTSVEAVKSAAEILPLVEDYVRLRKAGGTYKGLCPFHQEKTPSFTVSPARGTFKCFGCGEGGDAIAFVEKLEQVDFVGAIEALAQRFGVQIEYEEISPEADRARKRKERLTQLMERATSFYERVLWDSEQGAFAREYLASRGLGEGVCRKFRLGYAPGGPTLTRRALQEGYTQEDMLAGGLVNRRGNDYFARRLVFPLANARGAVRGFQARRLHDDDPLQAKYVNSPESDLFKKGDLLYGLDTARQAIAKQDRAVVVEGNTDVLALRQAGFEPVVASMGTALTAQQLRELNRLTKRLFLCFDSDAAGEDATLRGMDLADSMGFDVLIVVLATDTDPADDPDHFQSQLAAPTPYRVHRMKLAIDRARTREDAVSEVRTILARFDQNTAWMDAVEYVANRLNLPREVVKSLPGYVVKGEGQMIPRAAELGDRLELNALAGCRAHPEAVVLLRELGAEHFETELSQRVARVLIVGDDLEGDLVAVAAELDARAAVEGIDLKGAKEYLLRLRERRLERELSDAESDHFLELQQRLAEVRTAIREFA